MNIHVHFIWRVHLRFNRKGSVKLNLNVITLDTRKTPAAEVADNFATKYERDLF